MNKSLKKLVISVSTVALLATGAVTTAANASNGGVLVVTVSKTTNLALVGESVTVSVTAIPSGFIYVYQCATSSLDPRPSGSTNCDASRAIALTNDTNYVGVQGILNGSQPQSFAIVKTLEVQGGSSFDCTQVRCAIFVRRGGPDGPDRTYDQLIPISFAAAKATQTVPAIGNSVKVGKFISFTKTTSAGLLMAVTTSTPKICSVAIKGANFKVTGKKAGSCKLNLSQMGSTTADPLSATVKSIRVTS
jgi:hypothetical protein